MAEHVVVLVTVGNQEQADAIAHALVNEQLAACVNIIGPVRSIYRWEGQVQDDSELLLVIKTQAGLFARVAERVKELHTYQTPEIIALPITAGSEAYLAWLTGATRAQ